MRLSAAILKTIAYADIFDYPLKRGEIWRFLIKQPTTYARFSLVLTRLEQERAVVYNQGFYTLPKRKQLIVTRLQREKIFSKKIKQARFAASILQLIPSVYFIGISGAVAMHNAPLEDDIDFFIIAAGGKLWLTRLFCVLLMQICGLRRRPHASSVKDKICLNMFMEARHLKLPQRERDLYSAHEIVQLLSVVNKCAMYEKFLSANHWVENYLPHAFKKPVLNKSKKEKTFQSSLFLEKVSRRLQLWYMQRHLTSEVIHKHWLRFHPRDARYWVKEEFQRRLKNLGLANSHKF